jgi:hypothetical protein
MYKDLEDHLTDCQNGFVKGSNLLEYFSAGNHLYTQTFLRPLIRYVIV